MAGTKRLVFRAGLMTPSLDGSNRFVVRKYRDFAHDFVKDEVVIGEFEEGLNVLLRITENAIVEPFYSLFRSKEEAEKNGGHYFDEADFDALKSHHRDLTWKTRGVVVFYEVLKVNDVPVVQINGHAQQE